jgi:uncharacterized protein YjbI with pentapeptide repeats
VLTINLLHHLKKRCSRFFLLPSKLKTMNKMIIEGKNFEREDFSEKVLPKGEYEHCKFINCNFSNSDLTGIIFSECEFKGCNMSMAKLVNTAFTDAKFTDCKLLGLHFNNCKEFLFSVYFENCILNFSTFFKRNLKKTKFKNSSIQDVDFSEADLSSAQFENCDLARTSFVNTNIEKADFRSSYNYSIDPEKNKIKKAKFSLQGVVGLLDKYNIEIE